MEGTLDNETPEEYEETNDFGGPSSALRPARSKASATKSNKKSGTANPLAAMAGPRARITANILKPKRAGGSGCYLRCFLALGQT